MWNRVGLIGRRLTDDRSKVQSQIPIFSAFPAEIQRKLLEAGNALASLIEVNSRSDKIGIC